ncbi:hypothetical protein [uncultured Duncaniella sp.]|uniref:hypothetical protein n=1 Tax=uncultured Duncaniella sp. TaxID=2768039 RepID=UPI0025A94719|nr:hypothetical protein [uncultured Duncaniella sp.]
MKKLCYLICLLSLALVGCKTQKQIPATLPPVVLKNSDSVRVETIVNTVYVPVEVAVDLPRQSESNATPDDSSHIETDLAFSDAWIDNDGILHHNIENKPGQLKGEAFVPQTTEQTSKESVKVKEVPVPQPYPVEVERKWTLMEQIKLATFWYLVGAVLINAIYIFRKPLLTALRKIIRL